MTPRRKSKTETDCGEAIRASVRHLRDFQAHQKRHPANATPSINDGRGRVTATEAHSGCSSPFAASSAL